MKPKKNLVANNLIAVACSGGVDSMALAIMMHEKQNIVALIVNHNLRPEAKKEAKRTKQILDSLKIQNKILEYKGKTPTSNIQAEARDIRYKLLTDYCKKNYITTIATAHHADDVAENFLLRLVRGSGVDGLAAIPSETVIHDIKIIRPILSYTKLQLKNFLKLKKIKWVEDATNKTTKYKRNMLRYALNNLEDKELVTKRINDAAQNLARARNYLEQESLKAYKKTVHNNIIDIKKLNTLHEEIAYRVLSTVLKNFSKKPKLPRFQELKNLKIAITNSQKKTLSGLIFTPKNGKTIVTAENVPINN